MSEEEPHGHKHEFSPRLINWVAWSIVAGALALILKRRDFFSSLEESIQNYIQINLIGDEGMVLSPRWTYLSVYLLTLLFLTGIASFYPKPWKTLGQIILTLAAVTALTPVFMLWNVYFLGPALLFSVMLCSLGAWISAWFIKDSHQLEPFIENTSSEKE